MVRLLLRISTAHMEWEGSVESSEDETVAWCSNASSSSFFFLFFLFCSIRLPLQAYSAKLAELTRLADLGKPVTMLAAVYSYTA